MPTAAITRDVHAFIIENFLLGRDTGFGDGESLLDTGIVDSTGIMHVVAHLENHYHIVVEDEDLIPENLETVERIAAFVHRKRRLNEAA